MEVPEASVLVPEMVVTEAETVLMVGQAERSSTSLPGTVGVCPPIKVWKITSRLVPVVTPPTSDMALLPMAGCGFITVRATDRMSVELVRREDKDENGR